jgi:outer membrane protein assembly factor BamA
VEIGYEKRDAGARAEISRRVLPLLRAAVFGQVRTVEITSADIPPSDLGATAYQVGSVGASVTWDKRDNAFNPSTGWVAALLADTNTLSDSTTFARTSGRLTWHYPLPERIRFAASARFGLLSQRSAVPIDERYFLGGATTVRSFQERELANSTTHGFPIGGSAYSLGNVETDFPLWQNLRGALFFDAGSLAPQGSEIPLSNFRYAAGTGLRYTLPVGSVRMDVGVNPDRRPKEHWGAAHLSFGFAF